MAAEQTRLVARVTDARHLELQRDVSFPAGSTVLVHIAAPAAANGSAQEQSWETLSLQGLACAYGEDEPDYPPLLLKEANPTSPAAASWPRL
jgi:hypothetical protein